MSSTVYIPCLIYGCAFVSVSKTCLCLRQFKYLMMKLDPSEEDSDDSGNGGRDSPVGEAGQMTDLEVCRSTVSFSVVSFALSCFVCLFVCFSWT